jgi:hypothetical protein
MSLVVPDGEHDIALPRLIRVRERERRLYALAALQRDLERVRVDALDRGRP